MSEQKEKESRIIPLDADQNLFFNWFLAYSYMLAPEDPKLQTNIFHYRLLQHVLENPARTRNFFNKKKNERYVRAFRKALLSKAVKVEISNRKKMIKRVGEIVRFLNAMRQLGINDPGIKKAYFLSSKGFQKREIEQGKKLTYTRGILNREVGKYNSVLHLCAAYSRNDPDSKKVKGPRTQKIKYFLSNSQKFREFLLSFKYTRQQNSNDRKEQQQSFSHMLQVDNRRKKKTHELIEKPLFSFPEEFIISDVSIDDESAKFIEKVERLVKSYSSNWEKKLNK